jgi:hypothetical protein
VEGITKPGFKLNLKANMDSTKGDNLFLNIKPDTTIRVRFLPPANPDGTLFFVTNQHFKLKNEEGRGIALADLEFHGDEKTGTADYISELYAVLAEADDDSIKKIADDIKLSKRWNAQVLVAEKDPETGQWDYYGPKILGLSKTTAEAVTQILSNQDMVGDDYFCDADNGQDLLITRTGSGFKTEYSVDRTGMKMSLDTIFPEWSTKFISDIPKVLNLNIWTREDQKAAAQRSFPQLDWEALVEYGL